MILMMQMLSDTLLKNLNEGLVKEWLSGLLPEVLSFFWSVLLALVVAYVGGKVIRWFRRALNKSMVRRQAEEGVRQFTDQLVKLLLYMLLGAIILQLFGITASSLAALVTSLGLTAGLALQGSLSNFAGGVLILLLHPFRVGDYIIEDTHKNEGEVVEISIFYTRLRTVDTKIIVVPNGTLANTSLTNVTKSDRRQLDLVISIGYDADIKKAKGILRRLTESEQGRISTEPIHVFVKDLNHNSVDLGLRFWVPTESYWDIRWRLLENIKYAFDNQGIRIPYQQLDVHLSEEKAEE